MRFLLLCLLGASLLPVAAEAGDVTIGHTASAPSPRKLSSVFIVIEDGIQPAEQIRTFDPKLAARVDAFTRAVGRRCQQAWPALFAAHDVKVKVVTMSTQKTLPHFSIALIDAPPKDMAYNLSINRTAITPLADGTFSVEFRAVLSMMNQSAGDPRWQGTITIKHGPNTDADTVADTLGSALIRQWQAAGAIPRKR